MSRRTKCGLSGLSFVSSDARKEPDHRYVVALVGDPHTGKSCLAACLKSHVQDMSPKSKLKFEEAMEPTAPDRYILTIDVWRETNSMKLKLIDTNGDDLKIKERYRAFQNDAPDGFMIFFAINDPVSFERVEYWLSECES